MRLYVNCACKSKHKPTLTFLITHTQAQCNALQCHANSKAYYAVFTRTLQQAALSCATKQQNNETHHNIRRRNGRLESSRTRQQNTAPVRKHTGDGQAGTPWTHRNAQNRARRIPPRQRSGQLINLRIRPAQGLRRTRPAGSRKHRRGTRTRRPRHALQPHLHRRRENQEPFMRAARDKRGRRTH